MAINRKTNKEIMKHTVTQIIKNDALLIKWQEGILTYSIAVIEDASEDTVLSTCYSFDIDTANKDDVGRGEFRRNEKGVMLLRWLQRAIKEKTVRINALETNKVKKEV